MSPVTADVPMSARILPINELFTGAVTALWATSYSIDLSLFNEFLLTRLGEPPFNIAALVDHRRLAASLDRIPAERADTLDAVNRNWLLRGVHTRAAFHPKSYLAVTGTTAKLLVGSGNLTTDGLNDGHEVFTAFPSDTAIGAAAIAAWRSWMRRLVTRVGDTALADRLQDLEPRLPPPPATTPLVPSPLLHNLDIPIADQFTKTITAAGAEVEELWLTAPFYDRDGIAVGVLLDALAPRRVTLFIHPSTKVDGRKRRAGHRDAVRARHVRSRQARRRDLEVARLAVVRLRESLTRRTHPDSKHGRQHRTGRAHAARPRRGTRVVHPRRHHNPRTRN
jgi:hypothetical protein